MDIQNKIIDKYKVQMDIEFRNGDLFDDVSSEEYVMGGVAKFQIRALKVPIPDRPMNDKTDVARTSNTMSTSSKNNLKFHVWIMVKFVNITNGTPIYIKFSSKALDIKNICLTADSKWHLITDRCVSIYQIDINFTIEINNRNLNKFKLLYDDNELTDFELRGDDGTVKVHKFMLSATSPVLETMLQGDWKETRDGYMHLKGISKATLEDFKQFIYFNTLPPTVSKHILIIAMRYEIPDMETICIKHLIQKIRTENVRDLLEFAITEKSDRLRDVILERVQKGYVKVDEVKKYLLRNK